MVGGRRPASAAGGAVEERTEFTVVLACGPATNKINVIKASSLRPDRVWV
jgi:ribosomal protein L7/L12